MHIILFFCLLFGINIASAQPTIYQDADTPSEAVGMMKSSLIVATKILDECRTRFPELAESMHENHEKWLIKESRAIRLAQRSWAQMSERDPNVAKMTAYVERVATQSLLNIANAPMPAAAKKEVLVQYCEKHFSDLASGVWRSRTPRTYKFMDSAPDRP
jgi:hypothetical protein